MLKITASLADGIPVDLRDTLTGLDDRNIQFLITAIRRASGKIRLTRRHDYHLQLREDRRNASLVIKAILHATRQVQPGDWHGVLTWCRMRSGRS